jgi:DNA (cytosine-5)-methyltransferase 1
MAARYLGVSNQTIARKFTPTESERLQGLPSHWTAQSVNENGELIRLSNSARYEMLGDAVAMPVAQWIGERLVRVHRKMLSGS